MNCELAKKYLTALERGELSEDEAQPVQAHLQECERCAADMHEMQVGMNLLHFLEPEDAPEGFAERVAAHLPEPRVEGVWGWGWKLAWGGGAIAIVFLGLGIFLGRQRSEKEFAAVSQKQMPAVVEAPALGRGYGTEGPTGGITPSAPPAPAAQTPLGPFEGGKPAAAAKEEAKQGGFGGFMAKINAPQPIRRGKEEPMRLAALPKAVPAERTESTLSAPAPPAALEGTPTVGGGERGIAAPPATAHRFADDRATVPPGYGALAPATGSTLGAAPVEGEDATRPGAPGAEKRFDLNLEGARLTDALRLIANVEGKSVVIGPGVKGTVTLRLKNVTTEEALDKLQKEFELSVERKDGTLLVKRMEQNSSTRGETRLA